MEASYLHNGKYILGIMVAKIEKELQEPNRSYVLDYYRHLQIAGKDPRTQARHLRELRFIVGALGKMDAKAATEADIKDLILKVMKAELAAISKRKILLTTRVFFSFLHGLGIDSHEYAEITKPIKITIRNLRKDISKSEKTAASIPTLEEIKRMVEVADCQVEKTMVMLLASTGMRVGELLNIKISDLQLVSDPNALNHVVVTGKTGTRSIPLFKDVMPFIRDYLQERGDAKGCEPLFIYKSKALDFGNVRFILRKLAERAGIKRRIHSHLFRYYLSTYFAANGKQESQMSAFFGYSPNIARHYTKLGGADSIMADASNKPTRNMLEEWICSCGTTQPFTNKICSKCMKERRADVSIEMGDMRRKIADQAAVITDLKDMIDHIAKRIGEGKMEEAIKS